MKAIRAHEWCDPQGLVMDEVEQPLIGAGEVLIRVRVAALNFPDVLLIAGKYQVKPPLPVIPGMEVAGTVEQVGEGVTHLRSGQRVLAQLGMGGFAEYAVAQASNVQPLPDRMSDEEAASFGIVYQTSYFGLADRGQLREGETVLVHSAAGGVGLSAVQLARALGAGRIIGTASNDDKLAVIRENGADVAINYQSTDFVEVVKRETEGRGADVIYDPVGGDTGERSTKCIAFEGRLIIIGFTSGKFPTFVGNHILVKNYSVVGLHWGAYRQHNPAKIERAWRALFDLYEAGKIKPVVGGVYAMEKVAEAMSFLTSRRAVGKIVLRW
jgi:NADPH2:quinone reductase